MSKLEKSNGFTSKASLTIPLGILAIYLISMNLNS